MCGGMVVAPGPVICKLFPSRVTVSPTVSAILWDDFYFDLGRTFRDEQYRCSPI